MTAPPPYEPTPPEYGAPPTTDAPYPYPPYPPYPYPPYGYAPTPQTNALAIASLVCAFLFAPLAILFGHLSLAQIRRSGEEGRGLAVAGLAIGYLVTVSTILFLVAGLVVFSWAARIARESTDPGGAGLPRQRVVPSTAEPTLPAFSPPAGPGLACTYPATPTAAAKPVEPPRSGKISTAPAVVDADMTTNAGTIGLRLDNAKAPCTVNSFVSLARQGYFDNTPCHRLTTGASRGMLQCGDPTGSGAGGPGYRFDNEYPTNQFRRLDPALQQPLTYPRGTLAMANAGPDSNGSQFFLVYRDSQLPPTYTAFGRIDDAGLATVDKLVSAGVGGGGDDGEPATPIVIKSVVVK